MSRDDYAQQGKQFVNDLRDTVSKKVSDNEDSILGSIGKAARWVDEKTGGKYSEQIGKAEAKVGEGVGWVGKQGTGEPQAPGAAAGDPTAGADATTGPVGPPTTTPPGDRPTTPTTPAASTPPPTPPTTPPTPPTTPPTTPPSSSGSGDSADWPRPPQS
ncbi:hypothetical protein Acsp06_26310 [Actinomycetospora sp. NBRC 106375]|uniref:antitoxin n=1 Tax=Actinomycetospora sp. NBRC 106375 TaxID=3032207 RepID=UPI0024A416E0|nr:antitoxin [Actinomycetospora sp. NBRC 106375]GLZ46446.1 hypothetical protein Acsp06_26310 [Actinomycetospora sp. NBRC 106375]